MQYFIVLQCLLIHLIQKVYLKMHCFLIIKFVGYSSFCKGIVVGIKQKTCICFLWNMLTYEIENMLTYEIDNCFQYLTFEISFS